MMETLTRGCHSHTDPRVAINQRGFFLKHMAQQKKQQNNNDKIRFQTDRYRKLAIRVCILCQYLDCDRVVNDDHLLITSATERASVASTATTNLHNENVNCGTLPIKLSNRRIRARDTKGMGSVRFGWLTIKHIYCSYKCTKNASNFGNVRFGQLIYMQMKISRS